MRAVPIIVAIPAKNEASNIGACIDALAAQTVPFTRLVLLLNNCTDATLPVCRQRAAHIPNLDICKLILPREQSSAGEARRLALERAARFAEGGVIMTTDADARPAPTWIERNLVALSAGADAVCGMATLNAADMGAIRGGVQFDSMRESFLLSLLDEISACIDPDPVDPWPRHQEHSGASIALTAAVLGKAGGPPCVPSGEDRALIARLRRVDARIRHAPDICVAVSGRLEGRAEGGMAATIKRRVARQDALTDDSIEPTVDAHRRALARARLRGVFAGAGGAALLAEDLLIDARAIQAALDTEYFGTAWRIVQATSPVLRRRRVAFAGLARETRQALRLRDELRENQASAQPECRHWAASPHAAR